MLVTIGIDPDACRELATERARLGRLVRQLREHCLLAPHDVHELMVALEESRHNEIKNAIGALLNSRLADAPKADVTSLADLLTPEDLASWRGSADLLLLAIPKCQLLEEADCEPSPEYATFSTALNTETMDDVDERWAYRAQAGDAREDIWSRVFEPLARRASAAYIIDRYAAKNLYKALRGTEGDRHNSGAAWFIHKLVAAGVRSVHFASSARELESASVADVEETIQTWFHEIAAKRTRVNTDDLKRGDRRLDLRLLRARFPHERRVSLDGFAGFEPHYGLDGFDGPRLREGVGLAASYERAEAIRKDFKALLDPASRSSTRRAPRARA